MALPRRKQSKKKKQQACRRSARVQKHEQQKQQACRRSARVQKQEEQKHLELRRTARSVRVKKNQETSKKDDSKKKSGSARTRPRKKKSSKETIPTDIKAKFQFGLLTLKNGGGKGLMVIATKDIEGGIIIVRYFGIITKKRPPPLSTYYAFELDKNKKWLIGKKNGGFGVSFNHSCDPNCEYVRHSANIVVLETLRPIKAGEELTTNYGDNFHLFFKDGKCLCEKCGGQNWRENAQRVIVPIPGGAKLSSGHIVEVEMSEEEKEKYACTDVRKLIK